MSFGSRESKIDACKLQRIAWKRNLLLVCRVCTIARKPLSDARRARGDFAAGQYIAQRMRQLASQGLKTQNELNVDSLFTG